MSAAAARAEAIHSLRRQLVAAQRSQSVQQILPTGVTSLDAILPGGGLPAGSLIEWISEDAGMNAASIALKSIAPMLTLHGCLAIIDERHDFNADAARCHGISLSRILLIRPARTASGPSTTSHSGFVRQATVAHSDALWALEQAARCPGVRVVLTFLEQASSAVMRRLQLAVERSGVTIVLIRPASLLNQPSFADLRLYVTATQPALPGITGRRRMKVQLLRSRHGLQHTGHAQLEVDHETGAVHSISELAHPKPATSPAF
ncbi:MAG: hypothetical protein O2856_10900 [Planctomycetota bacterium]|nr:hypothetical protein [Planctomycetota bacterium]